MKENFCYFDCSSTTQPLPEVVSKMNDVLQHTWGNPSSLHNFGVLAETIMEEARACIANALAAKEKEIYFAPSGTISVNTGLLGAAFARKRRGNHIITTAMEHSAVAESVNELERQGFEVTRITPALDGTDFVEKILEAIREDTILISTMMVNNETGTISPVEEMARAVKRINSKILIHTDAVQAFLKLPISLRNSQIDLLSISGHKVHASKGIGALYIKDGVTIQPLFFGGGQEKKFFSGTENVPSIAGFGTAVRALSLRQRADEIQVKKQNTLLRKELSKCADIQILSPENGLPNILGISVKGIRSEVLLHFLEQKNVFVSSGSACAKGKQSRALLAFGVPPEVADSFIRISMDGFTTEEEVLQLLSALEEARGALQKTR